jgi:hypothetical protein
VLLARALELDGTPQVKEALSLVAHGSPHPRRGSLLLLQAPAAQAPILVTLTDPDGSLHHEAPFAISDAGMGLYSIERSALLEPGTVLSIRAPERPVPLKALSVGLETLSFTPEEPLPRRVRSELELLRDGEAIELVWDGSGFAPKKKG